MAEMDNQGDIVVEIVWRESIEVQEARGTCSQGACADSGGSEAKAREGGVDVVSYQQAQPARLPGRRVS